MPKKKKTRRRRKVFSILNAVEAWIYGEIIMHGSTGSSILGFFTSEGDIGFESSGMGAASTMVPVGTSVINLADLMTEPGLAVSTMSQMFKSNLLPMALAAFTTSVTFRIGKSLLRRPLSSINRNLIKPALGAGVRL
tara:strand:- start:357 stop:767 length:411 start_codon:yes stop_codon:yes gene_type:complete